MFTMMEDDHSQVGNFGLFLNFDRAGFKFSYLTHELSSTTGDQK